LFDNQSSKSSRVITRELPSCSLKMELFFAQLVEFPSREEGLLELMSEVQGTPLFISADLAETEAINIISRTC